MKKIFLTIALFTIGYMFLSCGGDDLKPITLKDRESTTISLMYPNDTKYSIPIQGGDGNYSIKSDNDEIVKVEMISAIDFSITVVGLGETKVTITDKSQNSLIINIVVNYETHKYIIKRQDVRVVGGDLTENQKNAIIEAQLAKIPVKVGGGYKFVLTDSFEGKGKGKVIIYTDTYGESKAEETTFEMKEHGKEVFREAYKWGYEIELNSEKRIFVLGRYYPATKTTETIPMALMEDVTQEVQKQYPKAELVITSQLVELTQK